MNAAQHTPAPWHLIREHGRDGSAIATIEPAPETMRAPNYWTVASVNTSRAEWAANACLIAAAPEMWDRIRIAIGYLESGEQGSASFRIHALEHLRIAFDKASGAQS